jgi:nitrogen PTS system EIIA component
MKSLLNALQDGRLIELTDNNKTKALEYLATLIEAIPDIGVEGGITEKVLAREQLNNTGIGKGWACPHARSARDGELVSAIGWSPTGIDYGSPDGQPVHLVVMYFVPDAQKNGYLKEISSLANAIKTQPALQQLQALTDLGEVRNRLLDAVSVALEASVPEAKARMIQLEVKRAEVQAGQSAGTAAPAEFARNLVALSILAIPGAAPIVLTQDRELVKHLEGATQVVTQLSQTGRAEHQGVELLLRASSAYQPDRVLYECVAFRVAPKPPAA